MKTSATYPRIALLIGFLLGGTAPLMAQLLTGISANWDSSRKEWTIYTDDDGLEGELKTRWMADDDWSDWSVRLGDLDGRIKMKWNDDPNEWEVRCGAAVVTARTLFKGDFREWRISGSGHTINIKTRFGNVADEWDASSGSGSFSMRAAYRGDPRDWYIEDEMEGVALEVKLALVFAALYSSSIPR